MFAKYQYKPNSSLTNIYSDIKALLTGTVDKNLLSANCDKPNTTLVTTVPAGWEDTSGSMYTPYFQPIPVVGNYNIAPVGNGVEVLRPIGGTNKILRSVDDGITWSVITLPVTLGATAVTTIVRNLTWNGSLWVMTNPGISAAYVLTSMDGIAWTQQVVTAGTWGRPVWNGSLWCMSQTISSQSIATSVDAITWVYSATALPSAVIWSTPTYANSLWVIAPLNSIATALATSINGTVWTSRTIASTTTGKPEYINGIWYANSDSNAISVFIQSVDGITWTSVSISSLIYAKPIYNNGIFVFFSSGSTSGAVYTSFDGINWMLRISPTYLALVVWSVDKFIAVGGNSCNTSPDGITWTTQSNAGLNTHTAVVVTNNIIRLYAQGSINAAISYNGGVSWSTLTLPRAVAAGTNHLTIYLETIGASIYLNTLAANSSDFLILKSNKNASAIRSVNADGISYKKVFLDLSLSNLRLFGAEAFGTNSVTNPVYRSDETPYAQQLDIVNGGVLYISASARHIVAISYLPITATWGATTGSSFSGVFEYSRDDSWNIGNGANPYPTMCWLNSSLYTSGVYAVRLKTAVLIDSTLSSALLVPTLSAPFPKQVLNADDVVTLPAIDVRVSNHTTFTYGILGGTLLGGIKQTVTSYGSAGDEILIGATNYFIFVGGTLRMLLPIT